MAWKYALPSAASESGCLEVSLGVASLSKHSPQSARSLTACCPGRGHGSALECGRGHEGLGRSDKHHEEESKQLHIAMVVG